MLPWELPCAAWLRGRRIEVTLTTDTRINAAANTQMFLCVSVFSVSKQRSFAGLAEQDKLTIAAVNNFSRQTTILLCKPKKKPNYYAFVKESDYYYVSVLDFNPSNQYIEIVDWRKIGEKGFFKMLKQVAEGAANSP